MVSLIGFCALINYQCIAPPPCIAHTVATLLHHYCTILNPLPTPRFHAIHYTIVHCNLLERRFGLYTTLRLPKVHGMYCNSGWSGGNTVLSNSVGDEGGERGAYTKGVFENNSIDACTKTSN